MTDLHGDMENCPRCGSDQATQVEFLDSKKLDYHVDIFCCDNCKAYLVSSCWREHTDLLICDTLDEALEVAKEDIEIQEETVLETQEDEENS